jgi:hypothetical protein
MNKSLKRIPHINPRATEHLRVRLIPEIRAAIEEEAESLNTSMTNVTLSSFALYFAKRNPKNERGNWLFWEKA